MNCAEYFFFQSIGSKGRFQMLDFKRMFLLLLCILFVGCLPGENEDLEELLPLIPDETKNLAIYKWDPLERHCINSFGDIGLNTEYSENNNCIDFREINLASLDLSGLDLRGSNFSSLSLDGLDFSSSDLSGSNFEDCYIRSTKFPNTNYLGSSFKNAIFLSGNIEDEIFLDFLANSNTFLAPGVTLPEGYEHLVEPLDSEFRDPEAIQQLFNEDLITNVEARQIHRKMILQLRDLVRAQREIILPHRESIRTLRGEIRALHAEHHENRWRHHHRNHDGDEDHRINVDEPIWNKKQEILDLRKMILVHREIIFDLKIEIHQHRAHRRNLK